MNQTDSVLTKKKKFKFAIMHLADAFIQIDLQ